MTTQAFRRERLKTPLRVYVRRFLRACLLLGVAVLSSFFLWLQTRDSAQVRFTGVVESEAETVGAVETARILSVDVLPGQRVQPGDVLVRLDPADRAMDLALQEARLADYEQGALRAEQAAERVRQTLEESERRCRQALQESAVELESERLNRSRDEAELAGLNAEIARLQPLVDKRLVSEVELSSLRPKSLALDQTVRRYAPLLDALQRRHDAASNDLREVQALLAAAPRAPAPEPLKDAVRQAAQTVRQAAQAEPFVLRATRAGVVSRVQRQPGDVVVAGEPLVRVASTSSMYITGLLAQSQLAGVAPGDTFAVRRLAGDRRAALTAQVEAIDPEVLDLLDPFNPAPRFSVRGRRVRLRLLDADVALVPGEAVALQPARQESWLESVRRICFFSGNRPASL